MIVSRKRLFCLALIGCLFFAMAAQVRAGDDGDDEGSKEKQTEGDEAVAKSDKHDEPARHHGSTRRLRGHRRHQKRSNMPAIQYPDFETQYQHPQARHHRNRNRDRSISISISGERRDKRRVAAVQPQQVQGQYPQVQVRAQKPRRNKRRHNRRRPQVIFVRHPESSSSSEEPEQRNIRVRTRNLNRNFNFMRSNNPATTTSQCCCGLNLASICAPCPCGSMLCTPLSQAAQCTVDAPNCACTGIGMPLVGCAPTCQPTPISPGGGAI